MSAFEVVVVVFEFGRIYAALGIGGQETLDLRADKLRQFPIFIKLDQPLAI
jgi:hypothetical protein